MEVRQVLAKLEVSPSSQNVLLMGWDLPGSQTRKIQQVSPTSTCRDASYRPTYCYELALSAISFSQVGPSSGISTLHFTYKSPRSVGSLWGMPPEVSRNGQQTPTTMKTSFQQHSKTHVFLLKTQTKTPTPPKIGILLLYSGLCSYTFTISLQAPTKLQMTPTKTNPSKTYKLTKNHPKPNKKHTWKIEKLIPKPILTKHQDLQRIENPWKPSI